MTRTARTLTLGLTFALAVGSTNLASAQGPGPSIVISDSVLTNSGLDASLVAAECDKNCCTIWDLLGVQQVAQFVRGSLTPLGRFLSPLGRAMFGPALLSDKFAESENPAMATASAIAQEKTLKPLKIAAIRWLAFKNCVCYPEITDALLAALDDCDADVRLEALKALHKQRELDLASEEPFQYYQQPSGDACGCGPRRGNACGVCGACQCQRKVVERLYQLLVERDERGCLKEKSLCVRELAKEMIEECITGYAPPPEQEYARLQERKARYEMEMKRRRAAREKADAPKLENGEGKDEAPGLLPLGKDGKDAEPADDTKTEDEKPEFVASPTFEPPPVTGPKRRYLMGELFGYKPKDFAPNVSY